MNKASNWQIVIKAKSKKTDFLTLNEIMMDTLIRTWDSRFVPNAHKLTRCGADDIPAGQSFDPLISVAGSDVCGLIHQK